MVEENASGRAAHLVSERARRFHSGGLGMAMDLEPEWSPPVNIDVVVEIAEPRLVRWRRALARSASVRALVIVALLICTGAGFASGRMWDGRNSAMLDLRTSVEFANDATVDSSSRIAAMQTMQALACRSILALRALQTDPTVGLAAEINLGHVRKALGE